MVIGPAGEERLNESEDLNRLTGWTRLSMPRRDKSEEKDWRNAPLVIRKNSKQRSPLSRRKRAS
jgi:hypothetical protein